jgi:hypothetical protein
MRAIYRYLDAVDFRKSSRALAAIVEQEPGHNPSRRVPKDSLTAKAIE